MNDLHDLELMLRSETPILLIESLEEQRILHLFSRLGLKLGEPVFCWTLTDGLRRADMNAIKYIGESERNLRDALRTADVMAPCVLWLDEIEKGLAMGSGEDGGTGRRLLGSLLTWMAERTSAVFLVATSNDISQLPPELVRKGRLDEIFFVDLPDREVRNEIFRIHLLRRDLDPDQFVMDTQIARLRQWAQGRTVPA